jgi:hypothetical protein
MCHRFAKPGDGTMSENRSHTGKNRHDFAHDLAGLSAQIPHQRLTGRDSQAF